MHEKSISAILVNFENRAVSCIPEITFHPPVQCNPSTVEFNMLVSKYKLGFYVLEVGESCAFLGLSSNIWFIDGFDYYAFLSKENYWLNILRTVNVTANVFFIVKLWPQNLPLFITSYKIVKWMRWLEQFNYLVSKVFYFYYLSKPGQVDFL